MYVHAFRKSIQFRHNGTNIQHSWRTWRHVQRESLTKLTEVIYSDKTNTTPTEIIGSSLTGTIGEIKVLIEVVFQFFLQLRVASSVLRKVRHGHHVWMSRVGKHFNAVWRQEAKWCRAGRTRVCIQRSQQLVCSPTHPAKHL